MAIDFEDASSQWLDMGQNIPSLNGKPAATIMCWTNIESLPGVGSRSFSEQSINGVFPVATSRIFFNFNTTGGVIIGARDADGGASQVLTAGTLPTGTWVHVCAVVDIANDANEIFIDAVSQGTGTPAFTNTSFPSTDSTNGAIGANDPGTGQFMDGIIEDFRLYDRVLTLAEIQSIVAARGVDGIVEGLVQRYLLNEGPPGGIASGAGSVKDVSAAQRNIDPTASPLYEAGVNRFRRRVA